jgi:hypothetical protein
MSHQPGITLKPLVKLPKSGDACWEWIGRATADGYPVKQFGGQPVPARRWIYTQLLGPIPDGLVVASRCGNRLCVNPMHLYVTFQAHANRAGNSTVLTSADIVEIRAKGRTKSAELARLLAERYGVTPQAIRDVWRRRSHRVPKPRIRCATVAVPHTLAEPEDKAA